MDLVNAIKRTEIRTMQPGAGRKRKIRCNMKFVVLVNIHKVVKRRLAQRFIASEPGKLRGVSESRAQRTVENCIL